VREPLGAQATRRQRPVGIRTRSRHAAAARLAANRRYLEFLSTIDDSSSGNGKLKKVSQTVRCEGRSYPGFNFFDEGDQVLFEAIGRGEFNISGLQNKTLQCHLPEKTSAQVSRLLKRLRLHRLVKKVGKSYKYYLTPFGKQVISAGLKLKELFLIPQLALNPAR
jgi:hypothetical protein